jgi:NADPH-dependent 2,4-dienoyl-CoA reductase/sulfur reductase-like enzyme
MARPQAEKIVVIGAAAAGLIAAHELRRAGKRVTILEARDRCGGRIDPLPSAVFSPRPSSRWNTAAEYTPALCFLKRVRTELRTLIHKQTS